MEPTMKTAVKLSELVEKLGLQVMAAKENLDREVTGGYVSDLLSDVLANSRLGNVWVTLQIHQNIVAVASMKEIAAIIIVNGRKPEQETIEKAETENIPIMVTDLPAFELVGRLYGLGVTGMK